MRHDGRGKHRWAASGRALPSGPPSNVPEDNILSQLSNLPVLVSTPLGRHRLCVGAFYYAWPLLRPLATAYRRIVVGDTRLVAVIGSLGKTTTTRAVIAALGGSPVRRPNVNSFGRLALAVLRIRPGQRFAVLEAGIASRGWMEQYARMIRPNVVVVTSIASEHGRSFGSLEVTRAEKAKMLEALPPDGLAVVNGDDPNVRWMAERTRARVLSYGLNPENDVRATEVALDWPHGTTFCLHAGGETRRVRVRLLGRHQLGAILAAITVALAEGRSLDQALSALETLAPTPGRLEVVTLPNGAFLLRDDYKAPLESIEAALDVLEEVPARRIVVLGDVSEPMGSAGPIYRRIGERVAACAARVVVVGNPRTIRYYASALRQAGQPREALIRAGTDVLRAAEAVAGDLAPGDVVLIKGRDTQRLDRVALALMGRPVRCDVVGCSVKILRCDECPMLERGWSGQPVLM